MSAGKRISLIAATVVAIAALIGAFVGYPAAAASEAEKRIIAAVNEIARASGAQVSDVTVTASGSNAISGLTGGKKVREVTLRIGKISVGVPPEPTAATPPPQFDPSKIEGGIREALNTLDDVGSFKLVLGDVNAQGSTVSLKDSYFSLSRGGYEVGLNFDKASFDKTLEESGVTAKIDARGHDISGSVAPSDSAAGAPIEPQKFKISVVPVDNGKSVALTYNGETRTEPVDASGATTVKTINFDSSGAVYSITVGGTYDYDALVRSLNKARDDMMLPPSGMTGASVPPPPA